MPASLALVSSAGRGICDGLLVKGTCPLAFGVPRYVPVADICTVMMMMQNGVATDVLLQRH